MANITPQNPTSTVSRRNSIAATTVVMPAKLVLPTSKLLILPTAAAPSSSSPSATSSSQSFGSVDSELIKLSSSYTSLKDLLPSSGVNSPTSASAAAAAAAQSGQIAIRNRLVKQAAWAYLQPMSTSPSSDAGSFFRRMWFKFSVEMSKNRFIRAVTRAFEWFLRVIRVRSSK